MPNISALGLDTSNYTTSAAFFGDGEMDSRGMILPVKEGEIGLRQSDAVFHHTRQLPEVLSMLGDKIGEAKVIGVSERPRDAKNSYMPCFLVGIGAAQMLAQALGVPLRRFSGTLIFFLPDRYCPVMERSQRATSSGVPAQTTSPPCTPAPGPMSMR